MYFININIYMYVLLYMYICIAVSVKTNCQYWKIVFIQMCFDILLFYPVTIP